MTPEKDSSVQKLEVEMGFVRDSQADMNRKLDNLMQSMQRMEIEMSAVKVKIGLIGTGAGLLGGLAVALVRASLLGIK